MKALRWHGRNDVRLDDVDPPPPPAADEIQVRILWCGICGTDVEELRHGPLFIPVKPHPLTGRCAPLTLGHEMSGEVVAVGENVERLTIGQLVALSPTMSCGACRWCRGGRANLCEHTADLGLAADGGLAEYCNAPAALAQALSPDTPAEAGALAEPLAITIRALERGRFTAKDRIAVFGGGPIGLLVLQAARAMGAEDITVVEPLGSRRAVAEQLGATAAVTPAGANNLKADLVLECAGVATAIPQAIAAADRGGRVVLVGICSKPVTVDLLPVVSDEKEVIGSLGYRFDPDYADAADLITAGLVQTDPLITDRIPLERALEDGLFALRDHADRHLKILISPQG